MYEKPMMVPFGKVAWTTLGSTRKSCNDPNANPPKSTGGPYNTNAYGVVVCQY